MSSAAAVVDRLWFSNMFQMTTAFLFAKLLEFLEHRPIC